MVTDGTSQTDRIVPALEEGYFNLDEMAFEEILAMAGEHARHLHFSTPSDFSSITGVSSTGVSSAEGATADNWEAFFTTDDAVIIAMILTTGLRNMETNFFNAIDHHVSQFNADYDLNNIPSYELATKIDFWFDQLRLSSGDVGSNLLKRIGEIIGTSEITVGTLRQELRSLESFLANYGIDQQKFRRGFVGPWFLGGDIPPADQAPTTSGPSPQIPSSSANREQIERFFRVNFHAFYNAVSSLKTIALRVLPVSLTSGVHSPSAGLYIAFIKLFQRAQEKANQFTQRHLDFYYNDVLKVERRPFVPDSTYLIISPDVAGRQVPIGEGTEFTAGVDAENQTVIYTANNDLLVNSARVVGLYTLDFQRDPDKSPENELPNRDQSPEDQPRYASGAKASQIRVLVESGGSSTVEPISRPLFGAPKADYERLDQDDAAIGFAVASPVLFLNEGEREINLSFKIHVKTSPEKGADEFLQDFLEKLVRINHETSHRDAPADTTLGVDPSSNQDLFFKAFRDMFVISLTTENGWYQVPEYLPLMRVVDEHSEPDTLKIQISLPPEVDSVVAYSADIHGGNYDCDLPLIRFLINPEAYLYPYSLLKDVEIRGIGIDVTVRGVREVLLHNNQGQLDPTGPFNPFGPIPVAGSYLTVGNPEIARKQITELQLDVEWGELPTEGRNFADYYSAYGMPFDNAIFEASVTVLRDGTWLPSEENDRPRVRLFGSEETDNQGVAWSGIRNNSLPVGPDVARLFKPLDSLPPDTELTYSTLSKNGFFRFTLSEPGYAFGHKEFPNRLTQVLTENAQLKRPELFRPVPNPPYTPTINSIFINYKAVSTIDVEQITISTESFFKERVFHIHPFGLEALSLGRNRGIDMLPQYDAAGNLFIGLSGTVLSGLLTLFFHLREDCAPEAGETSAGIEWHYLASNRWVPFGNSDVITDTTNGFLTSGIVTLNIPDGINRENTVIPGNLFWLRVSSTSHPEALCSLYSIYAQALKVNWQAQANSVSRLQRRLPAGTIKESRVSITGIGKIDQIIDSFGGSLPESARKARTRISERLKHKNRASAPWDYERLILERFPDLFKVKCFTNMVVDPAPANRLDPGTILKPGHILIVVIPDPKERPSAHLKPTVNGLVLREIKEFVQGCASPFVNIEVRNPTYEQIQIRCTVKFREGEGRGFYLTALDQDISDYISPWITREGYYPQFGWSIRRHDIELYIRSLDYVEMVTDFSMLHIADDGQGYFHLFDTERGPAVSTEIRPFQPWSIAVPARRHFIATTQGMESIDPEITGINELEIGSTFIITGD